MYLKKLKNLLQFDASKYIFLALSTTLFIFNKTSYLAVFLLLLLMVFLIKNTKYLFLYALIIIALVSIRLNHIDSIDADVSGIVVGEVKCVEDGYVIVSLPNRYILYTNKANELQPGDIIQADVSQYKLQFRNIPHNFDYETYLKSQNIEGVLVTDNIRIKSHKFNYRIIGYRFKNYIEGRFSNKISSYIELFVLGDKSGLDTEIVEQTNQLGIAHLFAISGMHIALLVGFLKKLLDRFYMQKKYYDLGIVLFLLGYNTLTGFKISIFRASILLVSLYAKDYLKLVLTTPDLLSFSYIGFLLFNPYLLYSVGFQLSYLVAFSIILAADIIKSDSYFGKIFRLSIYASLVSLPIILELNFKYGLLNVFANVYFFVFVSVLFLPISFLVIFFPDIKPFYVFIIDIFEKSVNFFQDTNTYFNINLIDSVAKVGYWTILLIIFIRIQRKQRIVKVACLFSVFLFLCFFVKVIPGTTYVRILDVNQGDAIHIHSRNCEMMIDTGKPDKYESILNYLRGNEITTLDFLLISHFHEDHYGGAMDFVDKIKVDKLLVNQDNRIFRNYTVIEKDTKFSCGVVDFQVLNADNSAENENNNSLVLFAKIGSDAWLFTGDIEHEIEAKIIAEYQLHIDVLKVAHHGSETSSSDEFIASINPKIAVVSVGLNNIYGFPDQRVLDTLYENDVKIYRTDRSGTVTFYYSDFIDIRVIETFKFMEKKKYVFDLI